MPHHPRAPQPFDEKHRDIARAATALQHCLNVALTEVVVGEPGARSLARRLGIDKMRGSQAMRIASGTDAADILSAMPGERGAKTLIESLKVAGAHASTIGALERAVADLQGIIASLNASPLHLSAMAASGRDSEAQERQLAKAQRLHFESGAALRGEMADAIVVTWFVTRSKHDPSLITLASLDMTAGFRTLRWLGPRLVHRGVSVDSTREAGDWSAIDLIQRNPIPSLVAAASTADLGPGVVEGKATPTGTLVLADPDAHPSRVLTLTFADLLEAVGPFHATPGHRTGELSSQIPFPVRHLYFDVMLDRTLPGVEPLGALFYSATQGVEYGEFADLQRFHGKVDADFVRSTALPAASKVDRERHASMLAHGAAMVGRPLEAFRCFRMHIAYPPSQSRAVVRWNLPAASDT